MEGQSRRVTRRASERPNESKVHELRGVRRASAVPTLGSRLLAPPALVIELGLHCVRCGFAGEARPHGEVRDDSITRDMKRLAMRENGTRAGDEEWLKVMLRLFHKILLKILMFKPKNQEVFLVTYDAPPTAMVRAAGVALLQYYGVASVVKSDCCGVALFPSGLTTGLVVDAGSTEVRCTAVAEGAHLQRSFQTCSVEGLTMEELLASDYEETIVHTLLRSIKGCPVWLRPAVVRNIVLVGGRWSSYEAERNPNLTTLKLGEELQLLAERSKCLVAELLKVCKESDTFAELEHVIKNHAKIARLPFQPSVVAWVGASIAAGLDSFQINAITAKILEEHPYVWDTEHVECKKLHRKLKAEFAMKKSGHSSRLRSRRSALSSLNAQQTSSRPPNSVASTLNETLAESDDEDGNPVTQVVRSIVPAPQLNLKPLERD